LDGLLLGLLRHGGVVVLLKIRRDVLVVLGPLPPRHAQVPRSRAVHTSDGFEGLWHRRLHRRGEGARAGLVVGANVRVPPKAGPPGESPPVPPGDSPRGAGGTPRRFGHLGGELGATGVAGSLRGELALLNFHLLGKAILRGTVR